MPDRRYTEREIADLIERAAERQQQAHRPTDGETLTLGEIERIAAEAGIDPAFLREAADELDAVGRTLKAESGATKTHVSEERWIDAPLTPATWEDAVVTLRDRFGPGMAAAFGLSGGGTVERIGDAYEWRHTSGLGIQTTVTASPRDGRTRLRLSQMVGMASSRTEGTLFGLLPATFFAPPMIPLLLSLGASKPMAIAGALAAFLVLWAVSAPLITGWDRRWRGRKHAALADLADDLVPVFGASRAQTADAERAPDERPPDAVRDDPALGRIDLDDDPEASSAPRRRRRRTR